VSSRACKVCRERKASICASCAPHQSAPELRARGDRDGLRYVEQQAQGIMRAIEERLPPGWGAVLLFSQYGEKGYASFVSTVDRTALPTFLRECAALVEERSDRPPGRLGEEH